MTTSTGRPKGVPLKGQKNINGEWAWPNAQYTDHEVIVTTLGGGMNPVYTETRTDAPASISHHETIHPRKGMTPYERRNWLNTRAGWPVRGTK